MVNSQNINLAICIQVTFGSENKLEEKILFNKTRLFSEIHASILKPCQDGNIHTYATTKELKKIALRINIQNIKQRVGIQVTFILEIKPQKKDVFQQNMTVFFGDLCVYFEHLLRQECGYVCHDLRTEKKKHFKQEKRI